MPSRLASACLACVLVTTPAAAHAQMVERVRVNVDTTKLDRKADATSRALLPAIEVALAKAGIQSVETSETELRVVVTFVEADAADDYLFRFDVLHAGELVDDAAPVFDCLECVTTDLAARVVEELPATYPLLTSLPETAASTEQSPETVPDPATPDRRPRPLGAYGKAGVALLATGLVGAGVGVGLIAAGERFDDGERESTNFRPPGFATLGVSLAVLVTGAVLLGIDRHRAKRRTSVTPIAGSGIAGFSVAGCF